MGKATNMRSWETYVTKARPNRNYGGARSMVIVTDEGGVSGMNSLGYISFARPFPLGAKILSATVTFHTWAMPETDDHTIYLRRVSDKFAHHRVTWENHPNVVPTFGISVTKSGALPTHEQWAFDVTEDLQKVSDGEPWYGWRVTTSDSIRRHIVAQEAAGPSRGFEPSLTIEWSDQPDEPASLNPDEGVVGTAYPALSFEYLPIDEGASMQMVHVQTSSSESFAVPTWDSGIHAWTDPTVYLYDIGYPGATEGDPVFWRIRVMDQGGWSGWSPVAEFTYIPEPGLTMTAPVQGDVPPGSDVIHLTGYISDATPQISWNSPGQVAYHVTVAREVDGRAVKHWLWDSGRVESTDNVIEIPKGAITSDEDAYRIRVRTYDAHPRISVANDHYTNSLAEIIVTMTDDPALTKVHNVQAAQVPGTPLVTVTWERGTAADEYQIFRDRRDDVGSLRRVLVETVSHEDVVQPDGTFSWTDHGAPPRTPITYDIYPVINGKRGERSVRAEFIETRLDGIWLIMPSFSLMVLGTDAGDWDLPESATAHQVIGATSSTIVREVHQGYQGSLSGVLIEESVYQPGLTSQMKRDRFLQIKKDPRGARLVVADLNIPVSLANLNVHPTSSPELHYMCSFDFWQAGEVWWERL